MDDATKALTAMLPSHLPEPAIELVDPAVLVPMQQGRTMASGVFRADGSFCGSSRTLTSANRFSGIPDYSVPTKKLSGRFLFAGIGRHHFGHFLLECVPRLWPLDEDLGLDGLIIIPKQGIDFEAVFKRRLGAFVDLLSDGLPVHFVNEPVEVDALFVASQGMGHRLWSAGTERFRNFMRSCVAQRVAPDGPERLYISRRRIKREEQKVDKEAEIERVMHDAGYEIFHPQEHSLRVQCARYMAASHIVGADGSAFHLAPFAMRAGTKVGVFQRRFRSVAMDALERQITAFCDVELTRVNPLEPLPDGVSERTEKAKVDLMKLKDAFREADLI
ncbi:MAG: glycosyltransferase family 61 protein [Pseudomonadota bacterium]